MKSAERGGRDPGLALLPRDVDLDEDLGLRRAVALELRERRVRGDGVDQLDERQDLAHLAALELADEVPAQRRIGPCGGLGLELLRAVLAEQREAGLGQHADVLDVDVLDRGEQLDVGGIAPGAARGGGDLLAHAVGVLAHADEVEAAHARHTTPAWRPVTPPSRRCEKNSSSPAQIVHSPVSWIVLDAGLAPAVARDRGQVEVALAHARAGHAGERARGPPRRPRSSSRARPGRAPRSARRPRPARAARRRPRPRSRPRARASRRAAPRRRRRRRASPAGSRRRTRARRRPSSAVACPSSSAAGRAGPGGSVARRTRGAVHLAAVEEALARQPDGGGEPLAVRVDVGAVVARSAGRG